MNNLKIGDRVRYIGKKWVHRGSFGIVTAIDGDRYTCNFHPGTIVRDLAIDEIEKNLTTKELAEQNQNDKDD